MKKCWIPLYYNVKDTHAMSELFEKLAKKGWHFHKLYAFSALFIKGEKQTVPFTVECLIPPRKRDDDESVYEYYEMCRQNGWEHIDGFGQYQVFKAIKGCKQMPLQSDSDLEFDHVYLNEKVTLITIIISLIAAIAFLVIIFKYLPKVYLANDLYLIFDFIVLPLFILIYGFKLCFKLFEIIKMKKEYLFTGEFKTKHHLLSSFLIKFFLSISFILFMSVLLFYKLYHGETVTELPFVTSMLMIALVTKYVEKREDGRQLKIGTHIGIVLICCIAYLVISGISKVFFSFDHPVDESRIIRMIDPDFEGSFTKSSSYFIPYQCKFKIASGNYSYELYVAKDLDTSNLVFDEYLMNKAEWNATAEELKKTLEPLQEPYTAQGYYLNEEHKSIIVHIDTGIIVIESNRRLDEPMVIERFNEQLNNLDLSY